MSTEMDNSHAESRGRGREDSHTRPAGLRARARGGGLRKIKVSFWQIQSLLRFSRPRSNQPKGSASRLKNVVKSMVLIHPN